MATTPRDDETARKRKRTEDEHEEDEHDEEDQDEEEGKQEGEEEDEEEGKEEGKEEDEEEDEEESQVWGTCCFCGDDCNPHSQACGSCMRSPYVWLTPASTS